MASKIPDPPLDLLKGCSNEELEPLVEYILKAWTNDLDLEPIYEENHPNHQKYVDLIADEIRAFGGHTMRNLVRGEGPLYQVVIRDVALRLKVKPKPRKDASIEEMELGILKALLEKAYDGMSEEEKNDLLKELAETSGVRIRYESGVPLFMLMSQVGIQMSGFLAYQMSVVVANAVARFVLGRGLTLATNAVIARSVSIFAGPIGWILGGLWLALDIAGPAYRVTIPCAVHIAYLRQKKAFEAAGGEV